MILKVDQYFTFNAFFIGKVILGPDTVVHKVVNVFLQGSEYLLIGTLDLARKHLNITPKLLGNQETWYQTY
jgi:hypothetical protein